MTSLQKGVKYLAITLAILLCIGIFSGVIGALSILEIFFSPNENLVGDMTEYSVNGEIETLHINIGAADITFKESDRFCVKSNYTKIKIKEENGKLEIVDSSKTFGINHSSDGLIVEVCVPKETLFESIDITTGTGTFMADRIESNEILLELGAGKAEIYELIAYKSADIDSGAGQVTVFGGKLANLDFDMGVGKVELKSVLVGKADIDCGIADLKLVLFGDSADYNIDIEKGIGNATINGADSVKHRGGGNNNVDIDGGIGKIVVEFE